MPCSGPTADVSSSLEASLAASLATLTRHRVAWFRNTRPEESLRHALVAHALGTPGASNGSPLSAPSFPPFPTQIGWDNLDGHPSRNQHHDDDADGQVGGSDESCPRSISSHYNLHVCMRNDGVVKNDQLIKCTPVAKLSYESNPACICKVANPKRLKSPNAVECTWARAGRPREGPGRSQDFFFHVCTRHTGGPRESPASPRMAVPSTRAEV